MAKFSTALLAPNASPQLTGDPQSLATLAPADNDNSLATTAWVTSAIGAVSAGSGTIRYDTTQSLTTPQKAVALRNIGTAQYNLINGKIVESHAANAATFAVKGLDGNDPSATNPVFVVTSDNFVNILTAAFSLTIPSATTLGTRNGQPFRLWFAIINDAGTPRLAVRRCSDFTSFSGAPAILSIAGFPATGVLSATAITGGNTAAVTYAGAAVTNMPYRVVAFADYEAGLATAGTWSASPTRIMPVGPATPLAGDIIQSSDRYWGQVPYSGSAWTTSGSLVITPTSICNMFRLRVDMDTMIPNAATQGNVQLFRNNFSTVVSPIAMGIYTNAGYNVGGASTMNTSGLSVAGGDMPLTVAATTYICGIYATVGGNTIYFPYQGATMVVEELMA